MKEFRIGPQITDHDLDTLVKRTQKWFVKKERVKIIVAFRGRQHLFMDTTGPNAILRFLTKLVDYKVINPISKNGKQFFAVVDPK